jgi:hypothetical protein
VIARLRSRIAADIAIGDDRSDLLVIDAVGGGNMTDLLAHGWDQSLVVVSASPAEAHLTRCFHGAVHLSVSDLPISKPPSGDFPAS